ncbi:MAG: hypothetical protein LBB14_01100 [Puniceicoccales bacterium]|jgi:hypothetical protein|nr:hypothetical protein [Puniceicoccales bacterium]
MDINIPSRREVLGTGTPGARPNISESAYRYKGELLTQEQVGTLEKNMLGDVPARNREEGVSIEAVLQVYAFLGSIPPESEVEISSSEGGTKKLLASDLRDSLKSAIDRAVEKPLDGGSVRRLFAYGERNELVQTMKDCSDFAEKFDFGPPEAGTRRELDTGKKLRDFAKGDGRKSKNRVARAVAGLRANVDHIERSMSPVGSHGENLEQRRETMQKLVDRKLPGIPHKVLTLAEVRERVEIARASGQPEPKFVQVTFDRDDGRMRFQAVTFDWGTWRFVPAQGSKKEEAEEYAQNALRQMRRGQPNDGIVM